MACSRATSTSASRYLDRDGEPHEEVRRGLTAGTFQHEVDHLNGILFLDRVIDPTTFMTWEEFERHHRDAFVARARGARRDGSARELVLVRARVARRRPSPKPAS